MDYLIKKTSTLLTEFCLQKCVIISKLSSAKEISTAVNCVHSAKAQKEHVAHTVYKTHWQYISVMLNLHKDLHLRLISVVRG